MIGQATGIVTSAVQAKVVEAAADVSPMLGKAAEMGFEVASLVPRVGLRKAVGSSKNAAPGKVYRGLSASDNPAAGLSARAPAAGNSEISHIAGKKQSQWISTTKDRTTAVEKYGQHGAVEIDLSKVPGTVRDVSGGFANGGRMSSWAQRDQEVLIKDFVPADAMTRIK